MESNPTAGRKIVKIERTLQILTIQISIVSKIVGTIQWWNKAILPKQLLYEISTFLFRNPLSFREVVYQLCRQRSLVLNNRYLLRNSLQQTQSQSRRLEKQLKINYQQKSQEKSVFISLIKQWRAIDLHEQNFNEILMKGKFLLNFLANVVIEDCESGNGEISWNSLDDITDFQKRVKQKNKRHRLICDDYRTIYSQILDILLFEKNRKINSGVVKSFLNIMRRNIVIVKIDQNYRSSSLNCQGKYLYFENRSHLRLSSNKRQESLNLPWLKLKNNKWVLANDKDECLDMYKETYGPYSRREGHLMTDTLSSINHYDFWIID